MARLHVNKFRLSMMTKVSCEKPMNKVRLLFFIVLSITLFSSGRVFAGAGAGVKPILDDARMTLSKAAAKGFEWTTTHKLIADAETALAGGDKDKSLKLAKAALNEAEKSLMQANYAETHWQDSIPL